MIVYQKNKDEFIRDVRDDTIAEQVEKCVLEKLGRNTARNEFESWRNSLSFMRNAIDDGDIPNDCGVSIEFQLPSTSKRVDFIISGEDDSGKKHMVIVELKQWSSSEVTDMDAMVQTHLGKGIQLTQHPSYQAWSYAKYLENFNEYVYNGGVDLKPCAFLHNYPVSLESIVDSRYQAHIDKAPIFRKSEASKLAAFIKQFVKRGENGKVIYEVEKGRIRPSKGLADAMVGLIKNRQEYILLDEQKEIFELVSSIAINSAKSDVPQKTVIIVNGGPGTGKSVVAINLLVRIIGKRLNCHYVTKNSAPREVFSAKLAGTMTKSQYSNLFKSSGSYTECNENEFDLLVVDEAHRLNKKSGLYANKGENQIRELIYSSMTSVFFVDAHQRVAFSDIGTPASIEAQANALGGVTAIHCKLPSQFRCAGSDGYLSWLDDALGIGETANNQFELDGYDFRVFDDPKKMYEEIVKINKAGESARLLAGYCWPWVSKKNPLHFDIEYDDYDFRIRWNDFNLGQGWIMHPESVEQAGCIHTSQGLEVVYAGVIIGGDLTLENGELVTNPLVHPGQDKNFSGLRKRMNAGKESREKALTEADELIRNTYRTLLTRGMKGTFVFCEDKALNEYFKERLGS